MCKIRPCGLGCGLNWGHPDPCKCVGASKPWSNPFHVRSHLGGVGETRQICFVPPIVEPISTSINSPKNPTLIKSSFKRAPQACFLGAFPQDAPTSLCGSRLAFPSLRPPHRSPSPWWPVGSCFRMAPRPRGLLAAGNDQRREELGRVRPSYAQHRPKLDRIRPSLDRHRRRPKLGLAKTHALGRCRPLLG